MLFFFILLFMLLGIMQSYLQGLKLVLNFFSSNPRNWFIYNCVALCARECGGVQLTLFFFFRKGRFIELTIIRYIR